MLDLNSPSLGRMWQSECVRHGTVHFLKTSVGKNQKREDTGFFQEKIFGLYLMYVFKYKWSNY